MRKRILYALFALAAAFLLSAAATAADVQAKAYAASGYTVLDRPMLAPFADEATAAAAARSAKSFTITEDNWTAEGSVYRTRRRSQGGLVSAYAVLDEGIPSDLPEAALLTFDFSSSRVNMTGYEAVQLGLQLEGSGVYRVALTLSTVNDTVRAETLVPADEDGGWSLIAADMTAASGRLVSMTIAVYADGNALPATVSAAQPYAVTKLPEGFANSERYSTDAFEAVYGEISMKTGRVKPDEEGRVYLSGRLLTEETLLTSAEGYFEITLSGVSSGNVMLGVLYAGSSEEQRVYGKKVSLNASESVYTIPVAVYDTIYSYSLSFDNLECEGAFRLEGVKVCSGGSAPASGSSWIGSVSSVTRTGSEVRFSGSMERDAAAQFAGQQIRFCAIPGWQADDLSAAVEIGSTKVTTRFEYTADLSSAKVSGALCMYFAAILTEDGTYLPLSRPRYPDVQAQETESASVMGLYQAAPAGVFESNASYVLADVPLNELLGGSDEAGAGLAATYTVYSGGESRTEKVEFSRDLLRELDRDIEFYLSAGVKVYLRLLCSSPVEGLTYGGDGMDNYAVDFSEPENRYLYAAVVRFLAERYPKTAGFVLGMGVCSSRTIGNADLSDAAGYAVELADLCRVTYNAASPYAANSIVAVPFAESAAGEDGEEISARTLAVMLANRLRDVGPIPWTYLYCVDSTEDPLTPPVTLEKLLSDLGLNGSGPSSAMIFCRPQKLELIRDYRAYCETSQADGNALPTFAEYAAQLFGSFWEACRSNGAKAAFLSLEGTSLYNDREFYAILKRSAEAGGLVFESRAEALPDTENETNGVGRPSDGHSAGQSAGQFAGQYTVWDFSDKYYAMDWIAGGGVSSCHTDYSALFSGLSDGSGGNIMNDKSASGYRRVLRAELEAQNGGCAGVTMCNLRNAVDLTSADAMDVTFALTSSSTEDEATNDGGVTVVFVIGTDEIRAEYYADSLSCGEIYTLTCDLSKYEYRSAADYIGVMVYADGGASLELSSVTLKSRSATDEELRALFHPDRQAGGVQEPDYLLAGSLCAVIVLLSAGAFVVINRRENEAEELRAAEEAAQRKTGRREYRT